MKTSKHLSISVVIPNYNGKHLLEANLPSVFKALKQVDALTELIVVDDASTDDSAAYIKQHYPSIQLLVNDVNKGFSPTINKGIFAAQYQLVLALNSDVNLNEDYFVHQFKYFEQAETFGVMGKIEGMENHELQDGAKYPSVSFKGIKTTYNYIPTQLPTNTWLPSFFLSGANALMDRKKLLALGGFDELYAPFYYEDADLGIRAWRVGWKCYFESQAVCTHATSSTISKLKSDKVKIIIERNRITINYLHLQGSTLLLFKCWLRLRMISKLLLGNTIIYKALRLFKENKMRVEQSRLALEELQKKNGKSFSVLEIEEYILNEIKEVSYSMF